MSITVVRGVRTTDLVSSSLIKREVFEAIYNFKPYQTPIVQFFLANKFAKMATGNPKFEVQEDVLFPYATTLSTAYSAASATQTIVIADADYIKIGDVIRNTRTNENFHITARGSSTSFTGVTTSGSNATAGVIADNLLVVGYAGTEAGTAPSGMTTQSTFPYNYAQIFKKVVHLSGTQAATVNYGGDDWINQRLKATEEIKLDLERSCIYGLRGLDTASGANIWYTGGLLDSSGMGISDSSQFVGTDFATEDYFFGTYCKGLFAKGTKEKTLYCGSDALLGINNYQKVKQKTQVDEEEYGVDVTTILTPFGRARLVWHPLLEADYSNWVIGVDREEYLKYRFLSNGTGNRDLQYQSDISTPGTDERKAQYLAQIGWHIAGGGQGVHRVLKSGASA